MPPSTRTSASHGPKQSGACLCTGGSVEKSSHTICPSGASPGSSRNTRPHLQPTPQTSGAPAATLVSLELCHVAEPAFPWGLAAQGL